MLAVRNFNKVHLTCVVMVNGLVQIPYERVVNYFAFECFQNFTGTHSVRHMSMNSVLP